MEAIIIESCDAVLTPQRGTEAVPAWGPAKEIKFLTCFRNYKKIFSRLRKDIKDIKDMLIED